MSATTISASGAQAYYKQVEGFERDRLRAARWLARIASLVAVCALLAAGAEALALVALLSRPLPDPVVFRVNETTGVVDRVYDVVGGEMTAGEAEQRYWVWQYVLHRERYYSETHRNDFDVVTLMSAPDVQQSYAAADSGRNPTSPQVVLGRTGQAVLSWQSTTFVGPNLAQVRYRVIARKGDAALPREDRVATVGFTFAKGGKVEGSALLLNPRGFLVTSYHSDQEFVQ